MGVGIGMSRGYTPRKKVSTALGAGGLSRGSSPRKGISPGSSTPPREKLSHESGYVPKRKGISPGSNNIPSKKSSSPPPQVVKIQMSSSAYNVLDERISALERQKNVGRKSVSSNGNPNPFNFVVADYATKGGNTLAWVIYPDCTNFEGRKILLLAKTIGEIRSWNHLDPHFINGRPLGLIARFEPSTEGWLLGLSALDALLQRDKNT